MKYPAKTLLIASLFAIALPLQQAQASSYDCNANKSADKPFNNSDAVIAASIDSIQDTKIKGSVYKIASITVHKYWKLKDGYLPTKIRIIDNHIQEGAYIMFLKYDVASDMYRPERCSPLIEIQQSQLLNMEQIYYLKTQPMHDVEE